jgi:arsenite methyltransferase
MCDNAPTDDTIELSAAEQRQAVRDRYGRVADAAAEGDRTDSGSCCGGTSPESGDETDDASGSSCCGGSEPTDAAQRAREIGYSEEQLATVSNGSNMGLSCGNPTAIANLAEGETVLDLGSGGGFDCFLASDVVGPDGRVIGVDMTPEMVEQARENARKRADENVEFRLGEIEPELEAMLLEAGFVDVAIEPKADDEFISEWHPDRDPRKYVTSARITARKPSGNSGPRD